MVNELLCYINILNTWYGNFINILWFSLYCMRCVDTVVWWASNLIWIRVKPRSPPSKRTVCDNLMFTLNYKLHISETILSFIPVNKYNFVFDSIQSENIKIIFSPLYASRIAENVEDRICRVFSNNFCTLILYPFPVLIRFVNFII